MKTRLLFPLLFTLGLCAPAWADMFFVKTSDGPGFAAPEEQAMVLENGILPLFDSLLALEKKRKIVGGGLAVGSRSFYLVIEAKSHDEVDRMLRDLPAWGVFSWEVTPLQSLKGRADMERQNLRSIKSRK